VPQRVITEDETAKLLSELLWRLKPAGQNQTGWENELAAACQNNPSTQANWRNGHTMPSLLDGLRLMAHLGEPFAKPLLALTGLHVGLEPSEAERELQVLRDEISRLANAAGNGGLRAVPSKDSVS
jgi:hypothetical protein